MKGLSHVKFQKQKEYGKVGKMRSSLGLIKAKPMRKSRRENDEMLIEARS